MRVLGLNLQLEKLVKKPEKSSRKVQQMEGENLYRGTEATAHAVAGPPWKP